MEATVRHHALEAGCFVVNATGWLSPEQVSQITADEKMQRVLSGGCHTTIISPEGVPLCSPITEGEGMAIADLDFSLITKRKRMMDCVGHYSRPDLLQLRLNAEQWAVMQPPISSVAARGTIGEDPQNGSSSDLSVPIDSLVPTYPNTRNG